MMIAAVCIVSALTQELETLQEIDAAFQRRQSSCFEVRWDAQLTVIENPEAIREERRRTVFRCPPQSLAVEGECIRYQGFRDPFYEKVGSELTDYVSYFDGQDSIVCRITADRERRRIAELRQKKAFEDSQNFTFGPLWMHFCTDHHTGIRLRSDQLKLLPEWETVNGTRCRILTGERHQHPFRIFVAPKLEYAVVRFVEFSTGGVLRSHQVDTQFQTAAGRIVPLSWHAQWFSGGMIHQTLKATVQRVTLDREPDRNHLRPAFPPGTQVQDIAEGIIYHVADDGSYQVERRMVRSAVPPIRRMGGFVLPDGWKPGVIIDIPN